MLAATAAAGSCATVTLRELGTAAGAGDAPVVSADGSTIVFDSASNPNGLNPEGYRRLFSIRSDRTNLRALPTALPVAGCADPEAFGPSVTANGSMIAYVVNRCPSAAVGDQAANTGIAVNNDSSPDVMDEPFGVLSGSPSLSADGSLMTYLRFQGLAAAAFIADPAGNVRNEQLTPFEFSTLSARLTADASTLFHYRLISGGVGTWRLPLNATSEPLEPGGNGTSSFFPSHDGTRAAFTQIDSALPTWLGLWMSSGGDERITAVDETGYDVKPATATMSGNGRFVVYGLAPEAQPAAPGCRLRRFDIETAEIVVLVDRSDVACSAPSLSFDGTRVTFRATGTLAIAGDTSVEDIFVADISAGTTTTFSTTTSTTSSTSTTTTTLIDQASLVVSKIGSGQGRVTAKPPVLIDCGPVCSAVLRENQRITLTAIPDPGSVLVGWDQPRCHSGRPCSLRVAGETPVRVTFAKRPPVSPKIIYLGVCGAAEENECLPGGGWYDPSSHPAFAPYNPLRDDELTELALTAGSGLDAIALRLTARAPNAIGVVAGFSTKTAGFGSDVVFKLLKALYSPGDTVVLAGHSRGGGIVQNVAKKAHKAKIPIAVLAQFDSIGFDGKIKPNVRRAFNFFYPRNLRECLIVGEASVRAEDATATIVTNVSISDPQGPHGPSGCDPHRNLDNDPRGWTEVLHYIATITD
jgi:hypothetical protein